MIRVTDTIEIDESEIEEKFIRSPGSGGQKVNKTETAVQLRFNARKCPAINHAVFLRLKKIAGRRMTQEGVIVLTAHQFRTQEMNRADALERLTKMIAEAAVVPKKRRLEAKKQRSDIKKGRARVHL